MWNSSSQDLRQRTRAILTDVQLWIPLLGLVAGIILLIFVNRI